MTAVQSCATCDMNSCGMHRRHAAGTASNLGTAFVVDDAWPEYRSYLAATVRPGDQILAPGLFGRPIPARYDLHERAKHCATWQTAHRHLTMRRVARQSGGIRQAAYLHHDSRIAMALASRIDHRVRHLVVAQAWLPWLYQAGALGGRSYDVLMSRYPFAEIHRRLDTLAGASEYDPSLSDFRAPASLVNREARLLDGARQVVTPHHDLAQSFGARALRLEWHRPTPRAHRPGTRVAFLGPTIARNLPATARAMAAGLDQPLIVFGRDLTGGDFWHGIAVERRAMGPRWLDDVGTVLQPAPMVNQPRALLQAWASNITVVATPGSGLPQGAYTRAPIA